MSIAEDRDRWLTTDVAIAREALAHPEQSPHLVAIAAGGQSWAQLVLERWAHRPQTADSPAR